MQATCHPDRRHKAHGLCEKCWRKTPAQRAKARERLKRWRAANPGGNREYQLAAAYGISHAEYEAMLADQGGVCAICGEPPAEGKNHVVDHDHDTGEVRGILCTRCNRQLGFIEAPGWLEHAMTYLEARGSALLRQ